MKQFVIEHFKPLKNSVSTSVLVLLAVAVFLPAIVSNLALGLILVMMVTKSKKGVQPINYELLLPILFFLLLALSYFWSIQPELTLHSIPRTIFLLILPLFFIKRNGLYASEKTTLLKYYSFGAVCVALFFMIKALIRYVFTHDYKYFFFHGDYTNDFGLVPKELNAIHVSVFMAVAFFYFISLKSKTKVNLVATLILLVFIILLSSSIIIFTTLLLSLVYFFYYSKQANRMRLRNIILLFVALSGIFFYHKIENFMTHEFKQSTTEGIGHNVIEETPLLSNKITLHEAWTNKTFTPNDFFPGMAFRVYQTRLFFEFLAEESIFWKGFGFNASQKKIEEKGIEYNLFLGDKIHEGYQTKNFHNQYIQVFAELGVIGFLILVVMLGINLKNAIISKDFMHFAFAILMISLFLTESFLWRQRGVVFFTLFYCLFNANVLKGNPKN